MNTTCVGTDRPVRHVAWCPSFDVEEIQRNMIKTGDTYTIRAGMDTTDTEAEADMRSLFARFNGCIGCMSVGCSIRVLLARGRNAIGRRRHRKLMRGLIVEIGGSAMNMMYQIHHRSTSDMNARFQAAFEVRELAAPDAPPVAETKEDEEEDDDDDDTDTDVCTDVDLKQEDQMLQTENNIASSFADLDGYEIV